MAVGGGGASRHSPDHWRRRAEERGEREAVRWGGRVSPERTRRRQRDRVHSMRDVRVHVQGRSPKATACQRAGARLRGAKRNKRQNKPLFNLFCFVCFISNYYIIKTFSVFIYYYR